MGRRAERHTMNTFVKLGDIIINTNSIDGIFPDNSRMYGGNGWIIQLNGKDVHVDDIKPILDSINMQTSTETAAFDPDKRIRPTNPTAAAQTTDTESTFEQKA